MESSLYGRRLPSARKVKTVSSTKSGASLHSAAETNSLPGIQLNDRQMKLYAARKTGGGSGMKEHNHSLAPPPPAKKPQYSWTKKTTSSSQQQQPFLGQEPTQTAETVPNTFSDDSASNASYSSRSVASSSISRASSSARNNAAASFYGQRLDPSERKMYDDQGNTWRDSQSEASSAASAAASAVSAALSAASRNSRSSRISRSSSTKKASSVASFDASRMSATKSMPSMGSMARLRQLQQARSGTSNKKASSSSSNAGSAYRGSSSRSDISVGSTGSSRSNRSAAVSTASSTKMSSASRSVVSSTSRHAATTQKPTMKYQQQEDEIMSQTASSMVGSSASVSSKSSRPALSVNTKQNSFSQRLAEKKKSDELQHKPSGLGTQKEKSKFLRSTMMQWAKPSNTASGVSAPPSALKSTKSSVSTASKSSKSSRRLSFAPKKAIISSDYRSPKSMASGGSGAISPKEMAIMRKVADRNKNRAAKGNAISPMNKNPRRAAGKMIKSTSSRMKKWVSSSSSTISSSSSSSGAYPTVETVTSKQSEEGLYDDSGRSVSGLTVNSDAITLLVEEEDAPADEAASLKSDGSPSPKFGEFDRRRPIVMEEDMDDGEGDNDVISKNQMMRKKSKRGRSSIFKRRIGNIGMGVMDDLIEENDALSSDDDDEEYDSQEEEEVEEKSHGDILMARSIKSNINTPRTVLNDSSSPRNINNIIEENKDFLKEMRKGPLKQALNTPSLRPEPTISESYDADADEYKSFVNSLKGELSGNHSKLYDSFQAMFQCGERGNDVPPKPLSAYPGSLDLKTKDSISKMSKYVTSEHDVECVISSQIVKDSDVRNYTFNHDRSIRQVPSTDSINGGDDGSQFEVTMGQHSRKTGSVVASSTNDSRFLTSSKVNSSAIFKLPASAGAGGGAVKFNQVKLKSRTTAADKTKQGGDGVPSSWTKVRLKPVSKGKTNNNNNNGRPQVSTEPSETAEFHRIVLRKTPTSAGAKKFDLALKTAPSSLTEVSGTENKPIDLDKAGGVVDQPIKLTTPAVAGTEEKPIEISPMSGSELKPIPVKDSQKGAAENPIKLAPSTGYDSVNPIQLVPSKGDESANPIVLAPSIDLDLNEGSIMVPLEKEAEAGDDVEIKVIVGKDGITKVQSIPGQGSNKANVVWRLERREVKSALLDMSTFSVKVIVSSDSNGKENQDLQFPTSAQCMKFANALHEMKNNTFTSNNTASMKESRTSTGSVDSASVYVEQLSDEEQKILDEFRQRKKNLPSDSDIARDLLSQKLLGNNAAPKPMSVVEGDAPSSPVSEVSSATSAMDTKTDMKYQLMLKMNVPKEVVKNKMKQDGVDATVIAKLLGEEIPKKQPNTSSLSPEDEKTATVYRKMLKMMVPPEAVAHKMKKDGINQKIVDAVLGNGKSSADSSKPEPSSALPSLSIPEQAAAQKYQKMLKMSVPKEAVEHKMKKDGIDAKIIAYVLGQSSKSPDAGSAPTNAKKASNSSLTSAEESTAATYRRMLKMSIPRDAVHHKMMKDGVSEKIISAVLGNNKKDKGKKNNAKKGGFGQGFHWSALDDDVASVAGSVWSKTKTSSEAGASTVALDLISKHVEEFQKKPDNAVDAKKLTAKSGQGGKEMAKLINTNRAQNVAITLKAFNDFTYKELAQNINFLDPLGKIKGDRALFVKDLLPTLAEVKAIKAYKGGEEFLDPAEKWFQQIINVKRIEQKVQVMRTVETFKMDAIVIGKSFQLLTDVCNQIMASDRLPDLLDMVRQIGNRMNEGRGDDAAGFKLDFLPRLAQTKGSDKKTTALDLVVLIFCTRNQRKALMLSDDYPNIQEASRIQFNDLRADVTALEASFRKCKTEFEELKKEHDASLSGRVPRSNAKVQPDSRSETALMNSSRQSARKFSGNDINTEIANRSPAPDGLSLMDAIKSRNGMVKQESTPSVGEVLTAIQKSNEEVRRSLSPRASLMLSFQEKNQDKEEMTLDASIRRMEKFVGEANYVILPKLKSERDAAVEACKDLASFFCEAPSERAASNLMKILDGFSTGINLSLKKYDEQQKILARKEAAMKKKKDAAKAPKASKKSKLKLNPLKIGKKRPTPESSSKSSQPAQPVDGEKKSLVLMVNEMLKVAGDKEIEDYVSGKSDFAAGSRLEKIVQKEEETRNTSDREDILAAIKRRRSVSTNLVPQQALSDLSASLSQDSRDDAPDAPRHDRRKSRVAQRWSSRKDSSTSDASGSLPPRAATKISKSPRDTEESTSQRRKSRVVNRWSSKPTSKPGTPNSVTLSTVSESTEDFEIQEKRRQSVVNRWASKSPKAGGATSKDLDEESDIGDFEAMIDKRKQRAFNRWASKRT